MYNIKIIYIYIYIYKLLHLFSDLVEIRYSSNPVTLFHFSRSMLVEEYHTIPNDDESQEVFKYKIRNCTYEKILGFRNKDEMLQYVRGYTTIKAETEFINSQFGPGRNQESTAKSLWENWLDITVARFITTWSLSLVPADIRSAVNETEFQLERPLTTFGLDLGATGVYRSLDHF